MIKRYTRKSRFECKKTECTLFFYVQPFLTFSRMNEMKSARYCFIISLAQNDLLIPYDFTIIAWKVIWEEFLLSTITSITFIFGILIEQFEIIHILIIPFRCDRM